MKMFTLKYLAVVLIICLRSTAAFAQYNDFRFTHLTTDDGLSQSNVISIVQDGKGFMWFGTFNGLNRFDGYQFEGFFYDEYDTASISHNYISAIVEDSHRYLWIGTGDGLNRFDPRTNSFRAYKHYDDESSSISDNQIERLCTDSKDRVWIGTRNGGLDLYDPEKDAFIHFRHYQDSLNSVSSNFIRAICEDAEGNVWIGHWNGAIDVYTDSSRCFRRVFSGNEKITDSPITAIVQSPDRSIWVSTQGDGLFRLTLHNGHTPQAGHYVSGPADGNHVSSNILLCLMVDRENNLWIGTEDTGLNILDLKSNTIRYVMNDPFDQSSVNDNSVWSVYEDHTGNIWIGTYAHGINLLTERKVYFQYYGHHPGQTNSLIHNMVNAFVEDTDNTLWIATDGKGLDKLNRKTDTFSHYNKENGRFGSNVIVSLFKDSRHRLWAGTWADGLYRFTPETDEFTRFSKETNGLGSNNILHIEEDRKGGLWLSTFWGGLTYFDPERMSAIVYNKDNSGLNDDNVRVSLQDREGNIWIGTDVGLQVFDANTTAFINYTHNDRYERSLSKGFVHSIIQTRDSTIWVGTTGGLNKFAADSRTFVHYTVSDGLPGNEVKCIIEDRGLLWLSTNRGISRFDPRAETFKNYDISDGLQGNEFAARSGCRLAGGEIVFGGNNGFNIFNPENLRDNSDVPGVVITDFKIFNKPVSIGGKDARLQADISETNHITLSYRDAVFSFSFVALNYISPERNQYAYIMEPFETQWNYVGANRTATYTNLDPGEYTFRVKASNNDGVWNEKGAAIAIRIEPPFWRTAWAYAVETLLGLALLYAVLNYFISRQRLQNALNIEHLELEKMYELDQMKNRFFTNISHEFNSPLTMILSPLEKLVSSRDTDAHIKNRLRLIQRAALRLRRMTNQLKDFQKIETGDLTLVLSRGDIISFIKDIAYSFHDYARDHHITFQFNADQNYALTWFDPDKVDKIIYNVLSNAFKFTPDHGAVSVTVTVASSKTSDHADQQVTNPDQYVKICIEDTGIGIPQENIEYVFQRYYHIEEYNGRHYEGSGIGLAFAYELTKLYHGDISVSSEEGRGSVFTIELPLDEHYLEENQLVGHFNMSPAELSGGRTVSFSEAEQLLDTSRNIEQHHAEGIPVIMIVEDDKEITNYIKNSLESTYRVSTAATGVKGYETALQMIPDLIISDIKLPELSGIEICKRLKNDEKTSHIPIILLTGYATRESKLEGLSQGADVYMTKPFNISELEAHIRNLLSSRKKLRARFSREILLEPRKIAITDIDEKFLRRVMDVVEKHMSDSSFNAELLSNEVGMSRMQLYRKLRGLTDQTVHEFIRSMRLKRAVQLLEEKRMTITEVAYEVGFKDLSYFARCFRKEFNRSPSEYISVKK